MEIKTFEKLFELKNELDLHKSTIEKLNYLQSQAERLRIRQARNNYEVTFGKDDCTWKPYRTNPLQYVSLVADSENHAEFKLNEDEWDAIVATAIKMKEDRINEILKEVEAI